MNAHVRPRHGGRLVALATTAALAVGAAFAAGGAAPVAAADIATPTPAAQDRSWEKYVLGPDSPQVYPVAVTETRGDVSRAAALVERNGGVTLTTRAGETPASVLVDFGKEMSGPLFFDVARTAPGRRRSRAHAAGRHR